MKQVFPTRIAEIVFALTIAVFGLLHFKSGQDVKAMQSVPSYMPGNASLWIYITGAGFLLIAAAIIINKYKKIACYALVAMLFVFFIMVHLPDLMVNKYNLSQPLKDIGLAMAAIIIGNNASK
jgi:putative oxidoreductase